MQPQGKVFFKDPLNLIQSKLANITQVCFTFAAGTPNLYHIWMCKSRVLNIKKKLMDQQLHFNYIINRLKSLFITLVVRFESKTVSCTPCSSVFLCTDM